MASPPLPTVTVTPTSVSVFSPWFWTCTSKARSSESVIVAEPPGVSALPPSETVPKPLPCSPGAAASSPPPLVEMREIRSATVVGSSQSISGRKGLSGTCSSPDRPSSLSTASMRGLARKR